MPTFPNGHLTFDHISASSMTTLEASEASSGLASSPMAMPVFFLAWIAIGLGLAEPLARRGHDRKIMVALGIGLGPLMIVVAVEAVTRREGEARPRLLAPGLDHGGHLDVLALIQGHPEDVRSLIPTLNAVKSVLATLTLARAVPCEWVEDPSDNEVIAQAMSALVAARELVPISNPALCVFPGTPEAVARRFSARSRPTLVLIAIDEATAPSSNC